MEKQLYRGGESLYSGGESLYSGGESLYSGGEPLYSGGEPLYQKQTVDKHPVVLAKYNDPKQINTVLDLIFNTAALETRYKSAGLGARFKAMQDMLMEQYVNPVIAGEWGVVGLNTLFSLGESVDVLGNVVKSITAPAFSAGPTPYDNLTLSERIASSIGVGKYGRINYDYATGNMFVDIVLEVVSDPATWVTMGTSMLAKTSAQAAESAAKQVVKNADDLIFGIATDNIQKATLKGAMDAFAKEVGNKEVMKEAVRTLQNKQAAVLATSEHKEFIEAFLGGAVKAKGAADAIEVKTLADALTLTLKSKGLLKDIDAITARQMADLFEESVNITVDRTTVQTLKAMDTAADVTNRIETVLMKAALSPTGVWPVYAIVTKGFPSVGRWINSQLTHAAAAHYAPLGDISPLDFDVAAKTVSTTGKRIKTVLDASPELRDLYVEPETIHLLYPRISKDAVFFSDAVAKYNKDPVAVTEAIRAYLDGAHKGATLDELLLSLEAKQMQLKSVDTYDLILDKHVAFIRQVRDSITLSDAQIKVRRRMAQLDGAADSVTVTNKAIFYDPSGVNKASLSKVFDDQAGWLNQQLGHTPELKALDLRMAQWKATKSSAKTAMHAFLLKKRAAEYLSTPRAVLKKAALEDPNDWYDRLLDVHDFMENAITKNQAQLRYVLYNQILPPIRSYGKVSKYANEVADGVENEFTKMFELLFADLEKLLDCETKAQAVTLLNAASDKCKAMSTLFGAKISDLSAAYSTAHADKLLNRMSVDAINLQELTKLTADNEAVSKHVLDFVGKLKDKLTKDPTIKTGYNARGIKASQMLANANLKFSASDVLNLKTKIRHATIVKKATPTLANVVNLQIPTELRDFMRSWDEQVFEDWLNTTLDNPAYVDAWLDVTSALQNLRAVISEERHNLGEAYESMLSAERMNEILKKLDLPETNIFGYKDGTKNLAENEKKAVLHKHKHTPHTVLNADEMAKLEQNKAAIVARQKAEDKATFEFTEKTKALADLEGMLEKLEHAVDFLKPSDYATQQTMIDANTHYITAKYEQLHNFLMITDNQDLVYVMSELKAGKIRKLLDTLEDDETDEVLRVVETFYSTRGLVQSLAGAALSPQTRTGVLATIQKQNFARPDSLLAHWDNFIENIVDGTQTNIQQTFQAKDRLNLDYIRDTNTEDYKAFRRMLGLSEDWKAHDAFDDNITALYVIHKQALEGYEPANTLLDSGVRIVSLDLETQNLLLTSGNTVHQIAVTSFDGRKLVSQQKHGLAAAEMEGLTPDISYLKDRKLTTPQYIDEFSGDEPSESELIMQLYRAVYGAVKDTFDSTDQVYRAVLNTHNGKGFDLKLLPAKVEQYGLHKKLEAEGIDPNLIQNLEKYDTFEECQKQLGYFAMSTDEVQIVSNILYQYVDEMNTYGVRKLFSAPGSNDLQAVMRYLKNMQEKANAGSKNMTELKPGVKRSNTGNKQEWLELNELITKIDNAFVEYQRIKEINQAFRKELIPAEALTNKIVDGVETMDPERRDMIVAYFKDMLGDKRAAEVIGDGKNITPSMIFGAFQDQQTMAYKNFLKPALADNYFVSDTKQITRYEAGVRMGVAKVLKRYEDNVQYAKLYVPKMRAMQTVIEKLMKAPQFAYLSALRTTNLNVQQTYAVFKFLVLRYHDKAALPSIIGPNMVDLANKGYTKLDWTGVNHFAKRLEDGEYMNEVLMYEDQLEQTLRLRSTLNEWTRTLDAEGWADASVQLNMVASGACARMLDKLVEVLNIDRHTMRTVRTRLINFTSDVKAAVARAFTLANADETVHWLAHSKGFVYLSKQVGTDYSAFLKKLASEEFVSKNIRFAEDNDAVWVWLTRDAKWNAMVHDGKIVYYANGQALEPMNWPGLNRNIFDTISTDLPEPIRYAVDDFIGELDEAYSRLMFMTDNNAGATVLEELSAKQLKESLLYMPQAMKETFYDDIHLSMRQMWQGAQYNHTYLGDGCKITKLYSSDIVSNLAKTTERQVMQRTTAARYTTAMMDPMLGVAKTPMAELYETDPKGLFKYLTRHQEIVLAVPMKSPHSKLGYRVEEVVIKRPKDLKYAFDNNARIMTSTMYNKLYEVLNDGIYSDTMLGHWQALLRMYKISYMFSPGTWARNAYDTFIKNMFIAKANPTEVAKATSGSMDSVHNYDKIIEGLYKVGEDNSLPNKEVQELLLRAAIEHNTYEDIAEQLYRLNRFDPLEDMKVEHVKAFLAGYPGMTYERFMQIHSFSMTAAAGGEAGVFSKMSRVQAKDYVDDLVKNGGMTSAEAASIKRKRTYSHITNKALAPMNYVERVARLAEFDMLTQKGYTISRANELVERTHFSYDTKTPIEQTMELMIPFYTFISRNFEFWVDALEFNPGYLSIMRDVVEPIWDLGQYDEEELQENESLQRQVLVGNLPIAGTDFYLSTGFSFMDALEWVTQPVPNAFSSMFSPIATVVGAAMQNLSDGAYAEGHALLSNWLQGTFGGDRSLAQLEDKYGSWTNTYRTLYGDLSEKRTLQERLNKIAYAINLIPLVGSVLSRMYKTGVFYDDENGIGKVGYLLGLATKASRWQDFADKDSKSGAAMATYASQIYQLLQAGGENIWAYTRLKNALGYQDVSLKDLPEDVKALILNAMTGAPIQVDVIPVLKDSDTMRLLWESALRKHNAPLDLDEAPQELLNEIYLDIAQSAVSLASIMTMLQNDESTRYSYAVAKSSLGLKEVKLSMLPNEALEVIEHAMLVRYYGTGPSTGNRAAGAPSRRRGSPRKSYHQLSYVKGSGTGLYDTRKGVYPNYGHRSAQKVRIYDKHYTKTGKSRMELRMMPITPVNLSYRRKDMFYYYK